ncbi:MAG: rod shape-determining protein [Candidatus Terrybacteria bacterium]|nr:rod shape-determining protein [Candidatus Terrybacteria bacterium]
MRIPLRSPFAVDIAIDLGTANTLVYVRGRGIVVNEPSVVALNTKTGKMLAIGNEAKKMVGRTPAHIVAVKPLIQGVISDFEVTEEMLRYFFSQVSGGRTLWRKPRVVIGIPSGVTEVEKRAVEDAARNAGASDVYLIEEPMAAAIGARLPVQDAAGSMVVDIGGGTTEIAVISLGGIVAARSLRIAGDRLTEDIRHFAQEECKLLLGERTAEEIKFTVGSAFTLPERLEAPMRGRDLVTGLPREVNVNDEQIRRAMLRSLAAIAQAARDVIEETPPELVADIMARGIVLAGGGALLRGLDQMLAQETMMPVSVADDPMTMVVRGAGIALEELRNLSEVFVSADTAPMGFQ